MLLLGCSPASLPPITEATPPDTTSGATTSGEQGPIQSPFFDGDVATVEVDGDQLVLAVADSSTERRRGLKEVVSLGGLDGMLFVHDASAVVTYTMEGTLIPLDAWFVDGAGSIIGRAEMDPCPDTACPDYRSPGPVAWVIETEQGRFDFSIGDRIVIGGITNPG